MQAEGSAIITVTIIISIIFIIFIIFNNMIISIASLVPGADTVPSVKRLKAGAASPEAHGGSVATSISANSSSGDPGLGVRVQKGLVVHLPPA